MADQERDAIEMAGMRFQVGIFEEALATRPNDTEALRFLSHAYAVLGRVEDGLAADRRLVDLLPQDPRVRYNLACSCALSGRIDEAFRQLEEACRVGFDDFGLLRRDPDLDPLRKDPRFGDLLRRRFGA